MQIIFAAPSTAHPTLPGYPWVDSVLLFEQVDGDGQRGRGRRSAESRRESIRHVGDKSGIQLHFVSNLFIS